ncbi:MAG: IPT/TIG domain-containing protein [Bacteroidota bacterium]
MNRNLLFLSGPGLVAGFLFLLAGCTKDEPPVVWDPNDPGAGTPSIRAVNPASALGGITRVTVSGRNFSRVDTNNVVYFGVEMGTVVSATDTALVVIPPDLDNGGYTITVVVAGAYESAKFGPYTVEHAGIEYGGFGDLDECYSLAVDAAEIVYAQLKAATGDTARVFTIPPTPPYTSKTLYGTLKDGLSRPWPKASDMRMGPGGYLYLQQTNNPNVYRIAPGGGVTVLYTVLPGRATAIEFDQNGNFFAGGDRAGVSVVKPDGSKRIVGTYSTMTIKALKVFNGDLYLAAASPGATPGVWKSAILNADGDLGTSVQVLSWSQAPGTFPASAVLSLAIAADGTIYVGSDNADPILMIPPGGTPSALYPGVLRPPATQLIWGTGQYLYCNRDHAVGANRRVIRIAMGKNGAPDYGRQ